nr:isoflavone 2'-hydroxylase-like [Tanacetum cinerariifolium]
MYLLKKPLHRTLAKISNQSGPVLFLKCGSRLVVVVSSPSAVAAAEDCFTTNDLVFANRPKLLAGKHRRNEETEAREFLEMLEENFRITGASNIGEVVPMMKWIGLSSIE